jgi:hypothetical protein
MPFCPPRGNNAALGLRDFGVDNRDFDPIYDTNGIHADLAVLKAIRKLGNS